MDIMSSTTSSLDNPSIEDLNHEIRTTQEGSSQSDQGERLSKKMQRRLRRQEHWLAHKAEKRLKEREKIKRKREAARLQNIDLGPSRKKLKESKMALSECKVRVAIDMDFDDLMNPRDLAKCVKQLMHCYTLNRRAENPMQLYFTSFTGKSEQEMSKNSGYKNWDVNIQPEFYMDLFNKEDIVYLTSESDNIITTLTDSKVYIIGGLVDHNAHKGICFQRAKEKGINHGQLPISEFVEMQARKVLTIDHVFEILLGVSSGLSWKDAFLKVIPQRKRVTTKTKPDHGQGKCNNEMDSVKSEQENISTCTSNAQQAVNTEAKENISCNHTDAGNSTMLSENFENQDLS